MSSWKVTPFEHPIIFEVNSLALEEWSAILRLTINGLWGISGEDSARRPGKTG